MPDAVMSPQEAEAFLNDQPAPATTNMLNVATQPQPGAAPTRLAIQTKTGVQTMTPEEADRFLMGKVSSAPQESLPPTQIIGDVYRALTGPSLTDQQFAAANKMEGVPIDITSGLPAGERFQLSMYGSPEERLKYLGDTYGRDNVRKGATGALIVRKYDNQGKPVDVVADERQATLRDALDFAGTAQDVALAFVGGGGLPKLVKASSALRPWLQIAGSAGGVAASRGIRDVFETPSTIETPREVLTHMGKEFMINAAFDAGLMGLGKGALFVSSPMMGRAGKTAIDATKGVEFLRAQGLVSPEQADKMLTLAMRTGSPLGAKVEATTSQFYRGRKAIQERAQQSYDAMLAAQNAIAGVKGPDAVFGTTKEAIDALETTGGNLRSFINEEIALPARRQVLDEADKAIQETTQRVLNQHGSPLESYEAGEVLAANAQFKKAQYQAQRDELYQAAKEALGGAGEKTIPIGDLPQRAEAWIEKTVPHKTVTTEGASTAVQTEQPMSVFGTPRAISMAREIASMEPGQKMSLDELITMRRKVWEGISEQKQAIPGADVKDFTSLADELTKAIDQGIKEVPNKDAAEFYRRAEAFVAKNQPVINAPGMEKLFWDDANPNSWLADLKRVRTTDKFNNIYDEVKSFYGSTSQAFDVVKKTLRQDLITQSMTASKDVLDGESLIGNLLQFARQNPQVFNEVFPNAGALRSEAEKLWSSNLFRRGQTLDSDAMQQVLNGQVTPAELQNLAMASQKSQALFKGQLMQRFRNGEPLDIDPNKFVSSFLYGAKEQEVRDVMAKVIQTDPEMAHDIEAAAITDLFLKTQRKPAAGRPFAYDSPWQVANPRQLTEALSENSDRLKLVVSHNTMTRLEQFVNVLKAEEYRDITGGMAGSFAGGRGTAELVTTLPVPVPVPNRGIRIGDLVANLTGQVNAGFWARVISSPTIERYMGNSAFRQLPWRDQWGLIFATTPLIEELGKQFGQAEAHKIAQALNQGFTRTIQTEDMLNTEPLLQQNIRFGPISTTSGF